MCKLPLTDREIPIVADYYVDKEFGTGAVMITPAHDPNDFEVGKRHNLTKRQLICFTGGALIGVPLFLLLRKPTGNSVAAMCMMLVMLPFFSYWCRSCRTGRGQSTQSKRIFSNLI